MCLVYSPKQRKKKYVVENIPRYENVRMIALTSKRQFWYSIDKEVYIIYLEIYSIV